MVGYLGRFVPEKGLEFLLRVLESQSLPWRALFVGTGPLEPQLRRWGSRFGDRVVIATDVRHDDAPKALNAMDILVAPSETTSTWREQFGRMVAEAFACGVPVLSSDSGELPFTVGDGGLVRKERDHAAWTTALASFGLAKRREERSELTRARTSVFSWPIVARPTLDFFADTAAQPASGHREPKPESHHYRLRRLCEDGWWTRELRLAPLCANIAREPHHFRVDRSRRHPNVNFREFGSLNSYTLAGPLSEQPASSSTSEAHRTAAHDRQRRLLSPPRHPGSLRPYRIQSGDQCLAEAVPKPRTTTGPACDRTARVAGSARVIVNSNRTYRDG